MSTCGVLEMLGGQVEALFDAVFVQFDAVLAGQYSDVELPLETGADLVDLEDSLDVGQGLLRGDVVDGGEPGEGTLGMAGLDGQPHVFDLVTSRAKTNQAIQVLDLAVVVIAPDLVSLHEVAISSAATDFADIPSIPEGRLLQPFPGCRADIRADVAVPAGARNKFDRELH